MADVHVRNTVAGGTVARGQPRALARKGTVHALNCQVITSLTNFVTTIAIARATGLEALGLFSIGFLVVQIARNFQTGILLAPMAAITPTLGGPDHAAYATYVLRNAGRFALIAAGGAAVVLALPGALGLEVGVSAIALPVAAALFLSVTADYFRRYFFVFGAPGRALVVDGARNAVQLAAIACIIVIGAELSAPAALLAMAAGGAVATVLGGTMHMALLRHRAMERRVRPRHREFLKWMTPGFALESVQMNLPYFIAYAVLSAEVVGLARAMHQFANLLNLPVNALQHIVPTLAAEAKAVRGDAAMIRILWHTFLLAAAFLATASVFLVVFSDDLIAVMVGEVPPSASVLLLAFIGLNAVLLVRFPLQVRAQATERPSEFAAAAALGALASLGAAVTLPAAIGAPGIPVALAVGVGVNSLVLWLIRHPRHSLRYGTAGVCFAVAAFALTAAISELRWASRAQQSDFAAVSSMLEGAPRAPWSITGKRYLLEECETGLAGRMSDLLPDTSLATIARQCRDQAADIAVGSPDWAYPLLIEAFAQFHLEDHDAAAVALLRAHAAAPYAGWLAEHRVALVARLEAQQTDLIANVAAPDSRVLAQTPSGRGVLAAFYVSHAELRSSISAAIETLPGPAQDDFFDQLSDTAESALERW
jgi:O-antigen/teichoic acid export membrane protein